MTHTTTPPRPHFRCKFTSCPTSGHDWCRYVTSFHPLPGSKQLPSGRFHACYLDGLDLLGPQRWEDGNQLKGSHGRGCHKCDKEKAVPWLFGKSRVSFALDLTTYKYVFIFIIFKSYMYINIIIYIHVSLVYCLSPNVMILIIWALKSGIILTFLLPMEGKQWVPVGQWFPILRRVQLSLLFGQLTIPMIDEHHSSIWRSNHAQLPGLGGHRSPPIVRYTLGH